MLQVRERLAGQRQTEWTIISTGLFMSFLFVSEFVVADLSNRIVRALERRENQVTITTPEDIGTMVSEAVYVPDGTINRIVFVVGEAISYAVLADMLDKAYAYQFQRELWDMEALQEQLRREANNGMAKYRNIFGAGQGTSWSEENRSTISVVSP